jgi:putative hydrolase of the HAD superfamily
VDLDAHEPVDTIVFDLDDTLIDWWGSWRRCVSRLAGAAVVNALENVVRSRCWLPHPDQEDLVWHRNTWQIHEMRTELWPQALPWMDPRDLEDLLERFVNELSVDFFPEVPACLDELASTTRLAVLSNNVYLPAEAERLGLSQWFDTCLVAHPHPKPDPRAFLDACAHLSVDPSRTVYVGDSIRADALGAYRAGLTPVWVDRFADPWHDRPTRVVRVSDLSELVDWCGSRRRPAT